MKYDIVLTKKDNRYLAQVSAFPALKVWEATREQALQRIRAKLQTYFDQVEFVQVDIDVPATQNPWLTKFGCFQDDPTFDDWQAEIAHYRQIRNAE